MKSNKTMCAAEIFQQISKRQVQALMFHDQMYDLFGFLNLKGFRQWHRHQYKTESDQFLNTKEYLMSTCNRLLDISDAGQPKLYIPESWYEYTRFEVTPQLIKQYTELAFNKYKDWEEDTKRIYEEFSKSLLDMGNVADAEMVNCLIKDVTCELNDLYGVLLRLKAVNYDIIYMLDMQPEFLDKYNEK